jgi:type I restriction enzyme M protein
MISKMKPVEEGGARLAIVFNASPLFTGGAGSGEGEIRRWIIENDWLEAIVALPPELFYNTGINTYIWIVTNRKEEHRKGKIQLIDATSFFVKMRRSLGNKRNEISLEQINEITRLYGEFQESEHVKIFDNTDFGYQHITVERPLKLNFGVTDERLSRVKETNAFINLAGSKKRKDAAAIQEETAKGQLLQRDILKALELLRSHSIVKNRKQFSAAMKGAFKFAGLPIDPSIFKAIMMALSERDQTADVCTDEKGTVEPDPELRNFENVPLKEDIDSYISREVLPYVPDAWVNKSKTKTGYEINFNRHFYKYFPPRSLEEIEADLTQIEREIGQELSETSK